MYINSKKFFVENISYFLFTFAAVEQIFQNKVNFLKICTFKLCEQFYRKAVCKDKNISNK
jgi:hypothetical protein